MYKFHIEKKLDKFDKFVLDNNGSVFQTSMGAKQKENWHNIYIMGEDEENNSVLSCLILYKKIAKFFKMAYIPLGFVCDYNNETLVKEFLNYLKKFTKEKKFGICFIDPTVILSKNGEINNLGEKYLKIFKQAKLIKTENKRPYIQPDTTFAIDLLDQSGNYKTLDDIVSSFEKGVKYSIRTSQDKGLKYVSYIYSDIKNNPHIMDEFMDVIDDTMERLEASTRSKAYFLDMLKNFEPYAHLNMVYYDSKSDYEKNNNDLKLLSVFRQDEKKNKSKINELESKIEGYNKRVSELEKYNIDPKTPKLYIAGGITVIFGNKAICLYGGSKNVLRNSTRSSHYLNYKRIEESVNHKCVWHDLSRIYMGNVNEHSKDYGLYLFKKSFNADEIKYIGEFTIVNNKFMYFSFTKVLPLFRAFVKKIKGTK